MVESFADAEV